jgi:hypothetical protein
MESHVPGWEAHLGAAAMVGERGRDDHLARLVKDFEAAEEASRDARAEAERSRDYYDGLQLTSSEKAELRRRGQPEIVINRIKRKIDYLLGHERATRTDPRAYPRTQQEEGAAEAATDALRYCCDQQHFDVKRSAVWENMMIEGFGAVEIGAEQNAKGEINPKITQVPWDRLFFDPHARRPDFSDMRYCGIVLWMDEDEALEKWPEAAAIVTSMIDTSSLSDTYDDRPRDSNLWCDKRKRRIRVVQMYYLQQATWYLCFFTKAGMLRESEPVPYLDEEGQPECPLILQSAYIDRDNDRYGVVREMIGPQDEINKRRSKALHLISVRQTMGEQGAVTDVAAMKRELAKPDGHVEIAPGMRFEKLDTSDMALAQFQLLQESKAEIDLIGPNAAMTGKDEKAPSGRAILASQQGGTIELGPLSDALRQWQWRVYRQLWNRIKQYWDAPKWIRVTDDDEKLRWVGLNKPVTLREQIQQDPAKQQQIQELRAQVEQTQPEMLQQFDQDLEQHLDQVVEVENHVAEMDIDISLQDSPDTVTLQAEQFELLAQMVSNGLPIPPDVIILASNLRNKHDIIDRMKGKSDDPAAQQQAAAQAQAQQLQQAELQAKVELLKAQAMKAQADAQAAIMQAQQPELPAQGDPPPSDLDNAEQMAKIDLEHAKGDLTRAQTQKVLIEAHLAANPPPPDPAATELTMAQADKTRTETHLAANPPPPSPESVDLTRAQAEKTRADAHMTLHPPPKPTPEARA